MKLRLLLVILGLCCLVACTTQTVKTNQLQSGGIFTAVADPGLVFPVGTLFAWAQKESRVYNDPRFDDVDLNGMLRDSIEEAIVSRGYHISDRGGAYVVSYVAALERALSDDEIDKSFGINPGLTSQNRSEQLYEKGTIIIDVADPLAKKSLWRSAMQGYVVFDLPSSVRKERVKGVVSQMFSSFPQGQ